MTCNSVKQVIQEEFFFLLKHFLTPMYRQKYSSACLLWLWVDHKSICYDYVSHLEYIEPNFEQIKET